MKKDMVFLFIVLGGFFVSCTSGFREFNTDLAGITDEDLKVDNNDHGIRLGIIQQGIYFNYDYGKGKNWPFQLIQNLNADMFSGYMHLCFPSDLPVGTIYPYRATGFFRYNENIEGGGHAPCDRLLRPDCVHQFCRS